MHQPQSQEPISRQSIGGPGRERSACGVALIARMGGDPDRSLVTDALEALRRMTHRSGAHEGTGDGSGILLGMPHGFFARVLPDVLEVPVPEPGRYAVGMVFLPRDEEDAAACRERLADVAEEHGLAVLGWRVVPVQADVPGPAARSVEPRIEQVVLASPDGLEIEDFERRLFVVRKVGTRRIRRSGLQSTGFHVCSLSARTIIYKGQLTPGQVPAFYDDLRHPEMASTLALVHSRFSTNTFPSWSRAQPFRLLGHNGEINTLRGNVNWMQAREPHLESRLLGADLQAILPAVDPQTSDSGMLDNVLELMIRGGRTLPESLLALIPEAWENASPADMSPEERAFYQAQASLVEPWDGPAAVLFTDGRLAGGILDRNGLRPARFWITADDRVILASEVGVVDVDPAQVVRKGRLRPGRIFLVDLEEGRIVEDEEVKAAAASSRPWKEWLHGNRVRLRALVQERNAALAAAEAAGGGAPADTAAPSTDDLVPVLRAFGYTREQLEHMVAPMVELAKDPVGSMGNDAALACLSDRARLPYDYLKQRFAQVTNPPMDSIRERIVTALDCPVGPQGNLLEPDEAALARLWITSPILSVGGLAVLKEMDGRGGGPSGSSVVGGPRSWRSRTISLLSPLDEGLDAALVRIQEAAVSAVREGITVLVLSDRGVDRDHLPVSALLATGAVHHHLLDTGLRGKAAIILDSGEPREMHHICALLGFGADAIHPWLVREVIDREVAAGRWGNGKTLEEAHQAWATAAEGEILKVMAKMGISTLSSYKGAQIFEALGLGADVIRRCFAGTESRIGGASLAVLEEEARRRHAEAWPRRGAPVPVLDVPGEFSWRPGGEDRQWNPDTIAQLQQAARQNSRDAYRDYSRLCHEEGASRATLRSLLAFAPDGNRAVPLEEVEPAAEIVKRFSTGAMSYGALSLEAHETLAIAMNRVGGRSNSGEGGEDPGRAEPLPDGDSRRSAIRQIASGRFGVSIEYLAAADQIQIKMAQGAKPGEGGQLPGKKVSAEIARVRGTTPGVMLISPPPHHDIYSIEDLAQLIFDLRNTNPRAEIAVKLVSVAGVGTVAAGVAKAGADRILIAGHDGGTGASPLTSIRHAGLPWELGLAETRETLSRNGLRDEVRIEVDGLLRTGRDVAVAALLGADSFGFSTAPLITLGCIMMRKCHLNTCPVGVCTQDPVLRKRFAGAPEHLINYLFLVAEEVREILAHLGLRSMDEAVGRTDLLRAVRAEDHWKAAGVDASILLDGSDGDEAARPRDPYLRADRRERAEAARRAVLDDVLDRELLRRAGGALDRARPVHIELPVANEDRAVGTLLSHEIARRFGKGGLPDGTIHVKLEGSAGQSLGAWLAEGVTVELEGDANDYVGKGLSGGRLILYPSLRAPFVPEETILAGNVVLYGAVRGQAFIRGRVGERFCVRNSGALAVVEGVGDHGCEYMTGGRAVILGPTGRNFAAGMSGGIAYVRDPEGIFPDRCNLELVELGPVDSVEDRDELRWLLERHRRFTGSEVARTVLADWENQVGTFVKVIPTEYRLAMEALAARRRAEEEAAAEPHIHAPRRKPPLQLPRRRAGEAASGRVGGLPVLPTGGSTPAAGPVGGVPPTPPAPQSSGAGGSRTPPAGGHHG